MTSYFFYPTFSCLLIMCLYIPIISQSDREIPKQIDKCPRQESVDWDMRAKLWCSIEHLYHCLQAENGSPVFYEFCRGYINIPPGHFPTYSHSKDEIIAKNCVGDTFQNRLLRSSKFNTCFKKKDCNRKGQLVCSDGSSVEDRRCKCDISINMVIKTYGDSPSNTELCCPETDPSCDCWEKYCEEGEKLNEVYQCVPKCKPGYYRPRWNSECIHQSLSVPVTQSPMTTSTAKIGSSIPTVATTASTAVPVTTSLPPPPKPLTVAMYIFISFASLVIIIVFIIAVIHFCLPKARNAFTTLRCRDPVTTLRCRDPDNPDAPELARMMGSTDANNGQHDNVNQNGPT